MNFFKSRAAVWLALLLILWTALALRLYALGSASLWDGEIFTLLFTRYDWSIFFQSVSTFSAHPPLWFAITKLTIGDAWNETLLRLPAAFAGVLSVPALYILGKRFFDTRVALLGAALLACSPLDVIFSQNARNYALFVFLVILLIYGARRGIDAQPLSTRAELERYALPWHRRLSFEIYRARWWLLYVGAAIAGLYTHYLFVLPLAGTALAAAIKLAREAFSQTSDWRKVRAWQHVSFLSIRAFLIANVMIVVLYAPWLPTVRSAFLDRQLTREAANEENAEPLTLDDAPRLLKDFSGTGSWGLYLFSALAVVGIAAAWWQGARVPKKRDALFWFGIAVLLPLLFMLLLAPRRLPAKYLIYVLPAFLMFVGNGVVGIADLADSRFLTSKPRALAISLALLALLLAASLPNMPYWFGRQTVFTGKGWQVVDEWRPWRDVATSIVSRAQPGDMILFPSEARALTARSVVPYFDVALQQKWVTAPPSGHVWWVSEQADAPASNASTLREEKKFDSIVVQELQHAAPQPFALPNASFENEFEGWGKSTDRAIWTIDTKTVFDGARALQVTVREPRYTAVRSAEFPVMPGKLYRVTANVKNATIGFYTASPQLFVNFYAPGNSAPKRTRLATVLPSDKTGWVLMVEEGIVPEDAQTARIEFGFREYALQFAPTSWVDNVQVWLEK